MTFAIDPGAITPELDKAYGRLDQCGFSEALWRRRLDVWSGNVATQEKIAARPG